MWLYYIYTDDRIMIYNPEVPLVENKFVLQYWKDQSKYLKTEKDHKQLHRIPTYSFFGGICII